MPRRGTGRGQRALVAVLLACAVGCDAVTGADPADDGGIHVRYVGSEAGVYDAYCFPVREEPDGRVVEIERIEDENIIDATYEYLPDGLKILDPVSPVRFADCREYDLVEPAPPPTTAPSTTTLAPTTVPPATVPATVPPPTASPPSVVPPPTVIPPPPTTPPVTPSSAFPTIPTTTIP